MVVVDGADLGPDIEGMETVRSRSSPCHSGSADLGPDIEGMETKRAVYSSSAAFNRADLGPDIEGMETGTKRRERSGLR